jgi:hypothetical protein
MAGEMLLNQNAMVTALVVLPLHPCLRDIVVSRAVDYDICNLIFVALGFGHFFRLKSLSKGGIAV